MKRYIPRSGNVILANFQAVRIFAQKMNAQRDLLNHPEQAVRAGQLDALALIDEISHQMIEQYRMQRNPQVMAEAMQWLKADLGEPTSLPLYASLPRSSRRLAVHRAEVDLDEYLAGESQRSDGSSAANRQIVLEELLMLWLANANPAFAPFRSCSTMSTWQKRLPTPRSFPACTISLTLSPPLVPITRT